MAQGKNQTYYINKKNLVKLSGVDGKGALINKLLNDYFVGDSPSTENSTELKPVGAFQIKFDDFEDAKFQLFSLYDGEKGAVIIINVDKERIFARINGMAEEDVAVLVGESLAKEEVIERL